MSLLDIVTRVRRFNNPDAGPWFHQDCKDCCAAGRCHWCLVRVGAASIVGTRRVHKGLTYRLCVAHMRRFMEDPHSPFGDTTTGEFTLVPVTLR